MLMNFRNFIIFNFKQMSIPKKKKEQKHIKLIYGFVIIDKDDYCFRDLDKIIHEPVIKAIQYFTLIKKFRNKGIIELINKDIIDIICKKLWQRRKLFFDKKFIDVFYRPMYGKPLEEEPYIGFEYDRVGDIFKDCMSIMNGKFQLSGATPPDDVVDFYKKYYPNKELRKFALIQEVHTSHYVSGHIMFGYTIKVHDENCELDVHTHYDDIDLYGIDHVSKRDYNFFIGKEIEYFNGIEQPEDAVLFAEFIHKVYKPIKENLLSRQDVIKILQNRYELNESEMTLSDFPILTFIPTMCYCCT